MAITKNIGKNTLGDRNKMTVRLRDYEMSSHDISFVFRNTQSPGTLVPFMKLVTQKGDIWDINLVNKTLTHPTVGPLFGSYKLQHFVFSCPFRLYNSWLHNNRTGIGMNMSQIKLPRLNMGIPAHSLRETNPSSLLNYFGWKGARNTDDTTRWEFINAVPVLAYYDIFKNYFANKQEKNFYIINNEAANTIIVNSSEYLSPQTMVLGQTRRLKINKETTLTYVKREGEQNVNYDEYWSNLILKYNRANNTVETEHTIKYLAGKEGQELNTETVTLSNLDIMLGSEYATTIKLHLRKGYNITNVHLTAIPLENLDLIRDEILATKGDTVFEVNKSTLKPFSILNSVNQESQSNNAMITNQYGLVVKTYDSDVMQNWINTDWIDGENGINEISAVAVEDGKITMDSLNLAQKVYNMLNRIAVSGGTYRDWLETVYTTGNYMERPETPVFEGGMTQWIEFEEVVSNSATENEPLGTLAGRGKTTQQKGSGKLHFKVQEPGYIIGLCAITPMVDYCQGNEWDCYLKSMDDLHKPALDGIGYQDSLNTQRAAWTKVYKKEKGWTETAPGKTVAWINYMTNFNKTFGNFATGESEEFMVLNRNYEKANSNQEIGDLTTYIDPSKHNEIFADTSIDAMNFWIQTACQINVRRNISAKQIPNL